MIYLTSDLHFGHNKEFLYKSRGFSSIEEHDQTIIKNWNSIVEDDDIVIMLGDLMLMDNEHGINCLRSLKGNKYYIRGNHDTDNRIELYNRPEEGNLRYLGFAFLLNYRKYHFYLSHYPTLITNFDDNKINPLIKVNNKFYIPLKGFYEKIDKLNKKIYVKDISGLML